MKTYKLSAEPRTNLGKKAAKSLRSENLIPVVLNGSEIVTLPYNEALKPGEKLIEIGNGKGLITTDLVVKTEDVRKLLYTPDVYAIELDVNGEKRNAVLREVQFHQVNDKKPVMVEVPVKLEGHAEGVKAGGKLTLSMKKIKVKAIYTNIPERVVVNIDHLGLGKTLQVGELHFEGLELMNAKNAVICAVQLTRAARGAQATAGK